MSSSMWVYVYEVWMAFDNDTEKPFETRAVQIEYCVTPTTISAYKSIVATCARTFATQYSFQKPAAEQYITFVPLSCAYDLKISSSIWRNFSGKCARYAFLVAYYLNLTDWLRVTQNEFTITDEIKCKEHSRLNFYVLDLCTSVSKEDNVWLWWMHEWRRIQWNLQLNFTVRPTEMLKQYSESRTETVEIDSYCSADTCEKEKNSPQFEYFGPNAECSCT